eukprot:PhF_6_TR10047/c0_g1_i1/m.15477
MPAPGRFSFGLTLRFHSPEIEQMYRDWAFHKTPMYNSKLGNLLLFSIFLYFYLLHRGSYMTSMDDAQDPILQACYVSMFITITVFFLLFIPALHYHREYLTVISVATHWPVWVFFCLHERSPLYLPHTYMIGCLLGCAFVTGARVQFTLWILIVGPIVTLAGATVPYGFFDTHSYAEAIWVLPYILAGITQWYFERQQRLFFVDVVTAQETNSNMIADIESTKAIVSNLFPKIAIAQVVNSNPIATHSLGCLVTDVKGFTAWSGTVPLNEMISVISDMFTRVESCAKSRDVERLITLGDSYVGIASVGSNKSSAIVCTQVLLCALDIVMMKFGHLMMRAGVDFGKCTGFFVGSSPLQYDVAGDAMTGAKKLEQTGEVGIVHVSDAVLQIIGTVTDPLFDTQIPSAQGSSYYVAGWTNPLPIPYDPQSRQRYNSLFGLSNTENVSNFILNWAERDRSQTIESSISQSVLNPPNQSDDVATLQPAEDSGNIRFNAPYTDFIAVSQPLVMESSASSKSKTMDDDSLTSIPPQQQQQSPSASGDPSNIVEKVHAFESSFEGSKCTTMNMSLGAALGSSASGLDDASLNYTFSILTLKFDNKVTASLFEEHLNEISLYSTAFWFILAFYVAIEICDLCVTCTSGNVVQKLLIILLIVAMIVLHITTKHTFLNSQGLQASIQFALFNFIMVVAATQTPFCADTDRSWLSPQNTLDILGMYLNGGIVGCHFLFPLTFPTRVVLSFIVSVNFMILCGFRQLLGFSDVVWEVTPLVLPLGLSLSTYFVQYTLVVTFISTSQLHTLQKSTMVTQHRIAVQALNIMMPNFAVNSLRNAMALTAHGDEGEPGRLATNRCQWKYPFVCVVFFEVTLQEDYFRTLDMVFFAFEKIIQEYGVWKVKCCGSTMILVCGIEHSENSALSDVVNLTIQAVLEITRQCQAGLTKSFRVGVDCGPCIGAIVGNVAYTFDIFGSTVNSASRLKDVANPQSVVLSGRTAHLLSRQYRTKSLGHIELKGIGSVERFELVSMFTL